jgi:caspase domain-containing protein/WG repeat protein
MHNKIANFRHLCALVLAVCAAVPASLFIEGRASARVPQEGRGGGLRTVGSLPGKEKRWALIIGVDNYHRDISPLYGSVNDAKALKETLVRYAGFPETQVILMTTDAADADLLPTRGNVLDALDRLSRQVPEGGLLLFSFSGHGLSLGEDAFIVPSDGKIYEGAELMRERAIDVMRIKKAIQKTKVRQVLMFIDACRDYPVRGKGGAANPLTESYKAGFSFDTRNSGVDAFATIFATSLGDRAFEFFDERTQQHRGYFSYAIERGLSGEAADSSGEVTLAGLIRYLEKTVRQRVYVEKNQRQVPYPLTEGYRSGDLVLALARNPRPARPAAAAATPWEGFRATAKRLLKYEYVGEFSEGLARARMNDKWGFIDRNGEVVITAKYDGVCPFTEGLACVTQDDKVGFIDKTGKQVIPFKYEAATRFADGLAAAGLNDKAGFIDRTGKIVIPFKFDGAGTFSEGLASVKLGDKYGFINRSGALVIPARYDYAGRFSEGLADVGMIVAGGVEDEDAEYNIGYIDKSGKLVIEMEYNDAGSFSNGMAVVAWHGKQGFINKSGKKVIPLEYDAENCECAEFADGLARVTLNGKYGFVNLRGSEVIPLKYDQVWCDAFRKEGFIGIELGGRKGFADIYGNEYFDL